MNKKNCLICNLRFYRKYRQSIRDWNQQRFCSRICLYEYQKIHSNSGHFIKGVPSWNKGKKDYLDEKAKQKISLNIQKYIQNETIEQRKKRIANTHKTMRERNTYGKSKLGKIGELDSLWKGEKATYNSKHKWIQKHWQKTGICEICHTERPPRKGTRLKWGTHWSNISGEYKRDRTDWYELCPKCHKSFDKR